MIIITIYKRWLHPTTLTTHAPSQYIWITTGIYRNNYENQMGMFSIIFHYYNNPIITGDNYKLMYQPY